MAEAPVVLYEERDSLGIITLNRPEKMNTLTDTVIQGIADSIDRATASPDVSSVIIRGAGPTFTAGYDLNPQAGDRGRGAFQPRFGAKQVDARPGAWDPVRDYAFMGNNMRRFMKLWECPKPVIAELHGYALGGGTDLLLCADLIFMAEDAILGYPPSRVYGTPTTMMWVYRVGLEHAKEFLLSGDQIDATTAYRIGLVSKVFPKERLSAETEAYAKRYANIPGEPAGAEQDAHQPGVRKHGPANDTDARHVLRWRHPPYRGGAALAGKLLGGRLPGDDPAQGWAVRGLRGTAAGLGQGRRVPFAPLPGFRHCRFPHLRRLPHARRLDPPLPDPRHR